jgi:hypothetical protein
LEPGQRLVSRYAQKKCLGIPREIRSTTPSYDYPDFTLNPERPGHECNFFVSNVTVFLEITFLWVISQPVIEEGTELSRSEHLLLRLSDPDRLAGRRVD